MPKVTGQGAWGRLPSREDLRDGEAGGFLPWGSCLRAASDEGLGSGECLWGGAAGDQGTEDWGHSNVFLVLV